VGSKPWTKKKRENRGSGGENTWKGPTKAGGKRLIPARKRGKNEAKKTVKNRGGKVRTRGDLKDKTTRVRQVGEKQKRCGEKL